jgi:hypothetical protein
MKTPNQILQEAYVGKVVKSYKYGTEDGDGRLTSIGRKIAHACFGFDDHREDAGLKLTFENGEDYITVFVHDTEEVELE